MLRERQGGAFASGMAATGFWLGLTVGRLVLGFVTPRIGERWAIAVLLSSSLALHPSASTLNLSFIYGKLTTPSQIYLTLSAALELLFWLIPSFLVSAIAVSLQGFFLGPVFPSAIVVVTKLLPKHTHVTAISFISAVGSSGGAIWPFVVGAVAQARGVQTLQPIILSLVVVMVGIWLGLPRVRGKRE